MSKTWETFSNKGIPILSSKILFRVMVAYKRPMYISNLEGNQSLNQRSITSTTSMYVEGQVYVDVPTLE